MCERDRNLKPVMSKRLFATMITTLILFSLNVMPANANGYNLPQGKYNCNTGVLDNSLATGFLDIFADQVIDNTCGAGHVNIPLGVVQIAAYAFFNNTLLTSVTIPDSVEIIAIGAFDGNSALTSVTIGNSVTNIRPDAFAYNTALISVTIPNSVTSIGSGAFQGNTALTSVTIGNSVISIGHSAFSGNSALTSVTIPDSVTSISDYAFDGNTALTSVTIGNSVTSIGQNAFSLNSALTYVRIGNSVTSIGPSAFTLTALPSVTIPASVTSIGNSAFESNTALTSVTFLGITPPTVGGYAFTDGCDCASANVPYNATGFGAEGSTWNNLIVRYGSAPANDSGSNSATIMSTAAKTPDAIFNLKNKKYLSKNAMKTKLSKNKSFKRNPKDLYKYSIFKASKKTCIMRGNYVMGLKKTGSCDLNVTRTTAKGAKYKYWVKINYSK